LHIDYDAKSLTIDGHTVREGEFITLEGTSGTIYEGKIELTRPEAPPEFHTLMKWCDARRRMSVRTNADTPADAKKAVEFGAEGIGLCRTEHMFFDPSEPQRLKAMRQMILADNEADRRTALDKLLPFQRKDFEGIFTVMAGKPVTIRLLDPPLHEFLPQHDNVEAQQGIVDDLNADKAHGADRITLDDIQRRVDQLHEANPMLGHRGCRLSITYPEIQEMQVRAIMEAAVACAHKGIKVLPEIMIPLSIDPNELSLLVSRTRVVADAVLKEQGKKVNYLVGTMVETPRAALLADRMADSAEFFSFGTNDLTQMTMGLSRDDAGRFLPDYLIESDIGSGKTGAIFPHDPFQSLDVCGVGKLMAMAVTDGRTRRPKIKLGVCGEHGGDEQSIMFCEQIGLDYVSCSPYRVPIARLAAAKATIAAPKPASRILKANSKTRSYVRPTSMRAKGAKKPTRKSSKKKSRR
ncbi:MAG: pyruvate, phosphate dikinase, partial [Planctomycetes bacterium]|nr:pyruvate, phosphate dikinase [Planctomycetota bacterium]